MIASLGIDYRLCATASAGRGGLDDAELARWLEKSGRATERLVRTFAEGEAGFLGVPDDTAGVSAVVAVAEELRAGTDDVLVLGIGGSSLGARTVVEALDSASNGPRLHFPDNVDPHRLARLLARCAPDRTAVLVVSKSGETLETSAHMLVVLDWLRRGLGAEKVGSRVVAVTDPQRGHLRRLAEERGFRVLPIPPSVGGRYSVLTAAGTLPAALFGVDVTQMIRGAAEARDRCLRPLADANPAALLAALHVGHMEERGHTTHVLMPYSDALRTFGAWWVQLWGESLGKRLDRTGRMVERGPTPIAAIGSTDQHALGQLFAEGPRDKLITFVRLESPSYEDLVVPEAEPPYAHLAGRSLHAVLNVEQEATALSLAADERPSLTVSLPRLDARGLGGLLLTYEVATALAGDLLGVDPFDQPGVERGKRIAIGMLGTSTAESEAARDRLARAPGTHRYAE